MDEFQHKHILEKTMLPYAEDLLPIIRTLQHESDLKHTARAVMDFLRSSSVSVLDWRPERSDLIQCFEHVWCEIKKNLYLRQFKRAVQRFLRRMELISLFRNVKN